MRVVDQPARAGMAWIREAFALFRDQPTTWISLMSCWLLITLAVFGLPLIGGPLGVMIQPALFAGLVLAARDQGQGRPVTMRYLVAGFRANGRALMSVGAVMLLSQALVVMAMEALGFPREMPNLDPQGAPQAFADAYVKMLEGKGWIILLGMLAMTLVKMALWFTSALLVFQPMPLAHALRWSLFAFVANFVPLTIFTVVISLLLALAMLPWLLGTLIWMPVYALAHYTSYRSVFRED